MTERLSDNQIKALKESVRVSEIVVGANGVMERALDELIELRAENARLREALTDVRDAFLKLHRLWDSDRDVHVGKLVIACLDASVHYSPLASRVAAAIAVLKEQAGE